jgi:hypothetical protein
VRRRAYGIEDVAGVDHQVHIALQDSVDSPAVSLLDVDLPLVAARLGMELRVPAVPQVCIRDVGDPYYLIPPTWVTLFYVLRPCFKRAPGKLLPLSRESAQRL